MTTISEALGAAWAAAAIESGHHGGFYRRRLAYPAPQGVFVGILQPSKLRQVSFEVSRAPAVPVLNERTRGYTVRTEERALPPSDFIVVHVTESSARVGDVIFTTLCADLIVCIAEFQDPVGAGAALTRRLQHWKLFFQNASEGGLSRTEGIGLYAELDALGWLLARDVNPEAILRSWSGPLGGNQDFSIGACAMEVKGTAANDADSIIVTNLRQLDRVGLSHLYLRYSAYDLRESAGTTLSQAVENVRKLISVSPTATTDFEDRLLAYGFIDPFPAFFQSHGFSLRFHRYFRVLDGFPQLLESSVPNGVVDVIYRINLSACLDYEVAETEPAGVLIERVK